MKRTTLTVAALLALTIAGTASAETRTYFGFQIGIGNAPPPPRVAYVSRPRMVMVPEEQVMVLDDDPGYDMCRYGSYYYVCNGGYWYRARSYRGPFMVVDVRRVPGPVVRVPARHWHHHPNGWAAERYRDVDRPGRGRANGHGHGHGYGHEGR
jgi:hypothetical protein